MLFKKIVDARTDARTMDNGPSQKLTLSTLCSLYYKFTKSFAVPTSLHNAAMDIPEICESDDNKNLFKTIQPIDLSVKLCLRNVTQRSAANALKTRFRKKPEKCAKSDRIAKKISSSGITFDMINLAHKRDCDLGVFLLHSEKKDNVVRVTNRKCIINSIKTFLDLN